MSDRFIEVPDWAAPGASGPASSVSRPAPVVQAHLPLVETPEVAPTIHTDPWTITILGRETVTVLGSGLIGRDPAPKSGEVVEHLIPVGAAERSVSKTHLAFGVDSKGFWVEDRRSTNGTSVRAADGTVTPCEARVRARVASGSSVEFGDLEFTVTAPDR